jgi:hypothetical protein
MPGRDARGPMGLGSQTGRGLGNCTKVSNDNTPLTNTGFVGRRSLDRGFGNLCRKGFRRFFSLDPIINQNNTSSLVDLENQAILKKIESLEQEISRLSIQLNKKSQS